MASLIMHLCVAKELINENLIEKEKENEFLLGTLLPDFALMPNAHYRETEKGKRFFNITKFREEYIKRIKNESLYLGYYLHLVQDIVFRDIMYNKYFWNPHIPGNVQRLYGDYRKLNSCLSEKYMLSDDILKEFESLCKYAAKEFVYEHFYLKECIKKDFGVKENGEYYFLTPDIAYEFLERALEACKQEIKALDEGSGHINERMILL
ncbi:MAG: zinc dependent phospholipase C family protein [Clostridia bacterium]|nr:zinc dependent phospholipase C family protein [Clostridia bacterium]